MLGLYFCLKLVQVGFKYEHPLVVACWHVGGLGVQKTECILAYQDRLQDDENKPQESTKRKLYIYLSTKQQ